MFSITTSQFSALVAFGSHTDSDMLRLRHSLLAQEPKSLGPFSSREHTLECASGLRPGSTHQQANTGVLRLQRGVALGFVFRLDRLLLGRGGREDRVLGAGRAGGHQDVDAALLGVVGNTGEQVEIGAALDAGEALAADRDRGFAGHAGEALGDRVGDSVVAQHGLHGGRALLADRELGLGRADPVAVAEDVDPGVALADEGDRAAQLVELGLRDHRTVEAVAVEGDSGDRLAAVRAGAGEAALLTGEQHVLDVHGRIVGIGGDPPLPAVGMAAGLVQRGVAAELVAEHAGVVEEDQLAGAVEGADVEGRARRVEQDLLGPGVAARALVGDLDGPVRGLGIGHDAETAAATGLLALGDRGRLGAVGATPATGLSLGLDLRAVLAALELEAAAEALQHALDVVEPDCLEARRLGLLLERVALAGLRRHQELALQARAGRVLLQAVGQLMRHQAASRPAPRGLGLRAHDDMGSDGEGLRVDRLGSRGGRRSLVQADVAQVGTEARLEESPVLGRERLAAGAAGAAATAGTGAGRATRWLALVRGRSAGRRLTLEPPRLPSGSRRRGLQTHVTRPLGKRPLSPVVLAKRLSPSPLGGEGGACPP